MATRFYLPSTGAASASPAYNTAWESTGSAARLPLLTTKSGSVSTAVAVSNAGDSGFTDVLVRQYVSAPLAEQTISGTVKGIIGSRESSGDLDGRSQMSIRVVSGDGSTFRGTLLSHNTGALASEFATTSTHVSRKYPLAWTGGGAAVSSVNAQAGDRIVVEVGYRRHAVHLTARDGILYLGDDQATDRPEDETSTVGDPWIEFSHNVAWDVASNRFVVSGNDILLDSSRFKFYGVCQYIVYPESSWAWVGSPQKTFYDNRVAIASAMAAVGINSIRLSVYAKTYLGTNSGLTQAQWRDVLGNLCDTFTAAGIVVLICDHEGTGVGASWLSKTLAGFRTDHFAMVTDLLADARFANNELVMFEPMNEPGPYNGGGTVVVTETSLVDHYKLIIDHYRAAGYTRPLVINPRDWSWSLDASFASALTAYDSQVAYANHRYPRGDTVGPSSIDGKVDGYLEADRARHLTQALNRGSTYPILMTEIGQNIDDLSLDANPSRPAWYTEAVGTIADDMDADTMQGAFVWMWAWDDGTVGNEGDNRASGYSYWDAIGQTSLRWYGQTSARLLWSRNRTVPVAGSGTIASYDGIASVLPAAKAAGTTASPIVPANGHDLSVDELRAYPTGRAYRLGRAAAGGTDAASAVAANSYFGFTVTPDAGKTLNVTGLTFKASRGGSTTPRGYVVRSSADGFATNLASADVTTQFPTWTDVSVPLTITSTGTLTFRIYVYAPASGNSVDFDSFAVTGTVVDTTGGGDTTPPVVSSIAAAPSTTSAVVTWTTNEPATSQVEYGTTTGYGTLTQLDTTLRTSHSVTLTGLTNTSSGQGTDVTTLGIVNNSTNDQQTAIQNMINAQVAGASIYFPAGDYRHSGQLTISKAITINGPGRLIGTTPTNMAIYIDAVTGGVTLDGLQIEGVGTGRLAQHNQTGITAFYGSNIIIRNCTVKYSSAAGIHMEGTTDFQILNNTVQETRSDAIHCTGGARRGLIEGNTVINPGDDCLACVTYGGQPLNQFLMFRNNNTTGGNARGGSCVGGYDITFENNTIANTGAAGIYVASEPSYNTEACRRVLIKGNTLNGCNTITATNHGGIFLWGGRPAYPIEDVTLENNTINNTVTGGAQIVIQSADVFRTNIVNNATTGTKQHRYIEAASAQYKETGGTHNGAAVANAGTLATAITYPTAWSIPTTGGQLYNYRILTRDASSNLTTTGNQTFTTSTVTGGGGGGSQTDTFTRSDAANLGANWTLLSGLNPRIVTNRVLPSTATDGGQESHVRFNTDTGSPDMYAQVDGKWVSDYGNLVLMARTTDINNRYFVNLNQQARKAELVRINAGSYLQLRPGVDGEFAWSAGSTVAFRLEVSGTGSTVTVTLKANGVTVFAYADTTAGRLTTGQRGGIGFGYVPNATAFEIDNYDQGTLAGGAPSGGSVTVSPAGTVVTARALTPAVTGGGTTTATDTFTRADASTLGAGWSLLGSTVATLPAAGLNAAGVFSGRVLMDGSPMQNCIVKVVNAFHPNWVYPGPIQDVLNTEGGHDGVDVFVTNTNAAGDWAVSGLPQNKQYMLKVFPPTTCAGFGEIASKYVTGESGYIDSPNSVNFMSTRDAPAGNTYNIFGQGRFLFDMPVHVFPTVSGALVGSQGYSDLNVEFYTRNNFATSQGTRTGCTATTPTAGLWPRIVTNRVLPNAATVGNTESFVRFDTDATSVNMYAQADYKWVSDYGNVVLLARFTDLNNRYFVNINQQARKAELVRVNAGAYTQLRPGVDGEFAWAVGSTVTFRLEVSTAGSIVTVTLKANGVTVFAYADTATDRLTTGQRGGIGFAYVPNATAFEIDNYEQGTLGGTGAVSVTLNPVVVAANARVLTLTGGLAGATSITLNPLSFTVEAVPLRAPQPAAPGTIPPVPSTYQPTPQQKLTRWNVYALNAAGERVAELDDYTQVDIIERRNRIGAWRMVHHANLAADLLTLDRYGVEFVRNGQTVMSGPVTVRQRTQNVEVDRYEFAGVDDLAYVSWRLASPQPSSYGPNYTQSHDVRSGPAASVIAAYVNANAGPGAIPPRRTPMFSMGANVGLGASVIGRARWQNLLDFVAGLAAVGGVVFSCKRRVFQVHVPVDRSATVRLSIQLGTAQAVMFSETVPTVNHPVVGAAGELTARLMLERDDVASQERWGRIESFVDRRDTNDPAEMLQAAVEALVEGGAKTGLTVDPIPAVGYGAYDDYQVGDLVTAVVGGVAYVDVVDELQIALTAEGETIVPTVGATEANPQRPRFFELVAKNRRALRDLERR